MKIKRDPNAQCGWALSDAPQGTILQRVTFTFPSITSHGPKGATHHIAGPAKVNIRVRHSNGKSEVFNGVTVEW